MKCTEIDNAWLRSLMSQLEREMELPVGSFYILWVWQRDNQLANHFIDFIHMHTEHTLVSESKVPPHCRTPKRLRFTENFFGHEHKGQK